MYCAQCRVEYGDGFNECLDRHIPLVGGHPVPKTFDSAIESSHRAGDQRSRSASDGERFT
jgi:hypothetical protein